MDTKVCRKCGEEKPLTEFHRLSRDGDRRMARCKDCRSQERREQHAANPEVGRQRAKDYVMSLPEDVRLERRRRSNLKHAYGISLEQYAEMLVAQHGVCAVCKQPETWIRNGILMRLQVDHDHTTGKIRGLLCRECNMSLGLLQDSVERLKGLIYYLERGGYDAFAPDA